MGGKLSSEQSPPRPRAFTERASSQRNGGVATSSHIHHRVHNGSSRSRQLRLNDLDFNLEGVQQGRLLRTNSAVEPGLRIPRNGVGWFYAGHIQDSDSSPDEGGSRLGRVGENVAHSLPHYFVRSMRDSKCPMCGKMIPAEDVEVHFVMCLTKPRVTYNEDVLSSSLGGECAICLENLLEGEVIGRLPCLCIYHKSCIEAWFTKSQTCPEHPPD